MVYANSAEEIEETLFALETSCIGKSQHSLQDGAFQLTPDFKHLEIDTDKLIWLNTVQQETVHFTELRSLAIKSLR